MTEASSYIKHQTACHLTSHCLIKANIARFTVVAMFSDFSLWSVIFRGRLNSAIKAGIYDSGVKPAL